MWCLHWCDTRQPRGKANDFTCLTPHTEMQKWPHIVIYLLQCWGRPCGELTIREDRNTRKLTLNTFITNSINKHYKHKIWIWVSLGKEKTKKFTSSLQLSLGSRPSEGKTERGKRGGQREEGGGMKRRGGEGKQENTGRICGDCRGAWNRCRIILFFLDQTSSHSVGSAFSSAIRNTLESFVPALHILTNQLLYLN